MYPKYRAWYKDKMWKVETIFINDRDAGASRIRIGITDQNDHYEWEFPFLKDLVLMPFVGFDKNGREIFEGDIVSYKYLGAEVKDAVLYNKERAGFEPFIGISRPPDWVHVHMDKVEVVGNINQNPELWKEGIQSVLS